MKDTIPLKKETFSKDSDEPDEDSDNEDEEPKVLHLLKQLRWRPRGPEQVGGGLALRSADKPTTCVSQRSRMRNQLIGLRHDLCDRNPDSGRINPRR